MRKLSLLIILVSLFVLSALPVAAQSSGTSGLVDSFSCSGENLTLVLRANSRQEKMRHVLWNAKFQGISQYPWNEYFYVDDASLTKTKRFTWTRPDHGDWAYRFTYRFTFSKGSIECDTVTMKIRLPHSNWGSGWSGTLRPSQ